MITFSEFDSGLWGNLGNQLFQYASMIGLAEKNNTAVMLPKWQWGRYFKYPPRTGELECQHFYPEKQYHYDADFVPYTTGHVNINGWLQSEKYWQHSKDVVKEKLKFQRFYRDNISEEYHHLLGEKTIAISIRRGDYVDNPNYELLPIEYYYLALFEHFPDWRDYNILVFSDDIDYCKVHFQCMPNVTFVEGLNPMEQLILGRLCQNFIIANSTFSWWMAYLGEMRNEDVKVIRPNYLFSGPLLEKNDDKDFWPERWTVFDHRYREIATKKIIPLDDVTIVIPCSNDSLDRQVNLERILLHLQQYFRVTISVGEQGNSFLHMPEVSFIHFRFKRFHFPLFHRTRMINRLTAKAETPIVINYDADILTPPLQIYLAVEALRRQEADFVYPYDGRFARVPRVWVNVMKQYRDVGLMGKTEFVGCRPYDGKSVGGVIAYRKDKFMEAGGENEKMISYAPEDQERFYRFNKLGYKVTRIPGVVYHLDHVITMNSSTNHEDYQANEDEFTKVKAMGDKELRAYVDDWGYFQPSSSDHHSGS